MHIIIKTVHPQIESSHTPIQETAVGTLLGHVAKRIYHTFVGSILTKFLLLLRAIFAEGFLEQVFMYYPRLSIDSES